MLSPTRNQLWFDKPGPTPRPEIVVPPAGVPLEDIDRRRVAPKPEPLKPVLGLRP